MKSKNLQTQVLSKYKDRQSYTKIHEALHGLVGLSATEMQCKMIRNTSRTTLLKSMDRPRAVRSEANIRKIKHQHDQLRVFKCRKIASYLRMSRTRAQRLVKDDLKLQSYGEKVMPKISEDQKAERLKFANWIRTSLRKEDTEIFVS